jgi:hypothetical protein
MVDFGRAKGGELVNEEQAKAVAEAVGGEPWQSGGDIWLVLSRRTDGKLVVISDEVVCLYDSEAAFEDSRAAASIVLH